MIQFQLKNNNNELNFNAGLSVAVIWARTALPGAAS